MGGFYFFFRRYICYVHCVFCFGFLVTYVSELKAHAMFFYFRLHFLHRNAGRRWKILEDAGKMDLRRAFRYNCRNLVRSPNDTAQASGNTANLQITQQRAQLSCLRITLHDCDRG